MSFEARYRKLDDWMLEMIMKAARSLGLGGLGARWIAAYDELHARAFRRAIESEEAEEMGGAWVVARVPGIH